MEEQNQKVGRTAQETERDDQKKENKKTGELRNLISEVVKFSVKICSKIRQFSFSLYDRDRNHLVARFFWLKVLCAYP